MDLATGLSLVSTIAVVCGVAFAAYQIRALSRQRIREAQFSLAASISSPSFQAALWKIMALPPGLDRAGVDAHLGPMSEHVYYWMGSMETLGILVHHRELPLSLVADFTSGPIVLSWRNLQGYVADVRRSTGRETMHEWFQWLAERLMERESVTPPIPAHVEFREWSP
jgi:hypothetical protein